MDNIQLINIKENIGKDHRKAKNGMCECCCCHKIKPLSEFMKDKRTYNGYTTTCLECGRKRERERSRERYYKKHREYRKKAI